MHEFEGKTAVITGAASGIGLALANRFADAKMRVVLADVEEKPLRAAEESLLERGVSAIAVQTDVRKLDSVEELHRRAIDAFGYVHVLCNNAGVSVGGLMWEQTNADWEWTLGVNLWGVIHGVRTFVPSMLAHGEEAHIVNTGSVAGLVAGPFSGPYSVSKFGVVALSESLFQELQIVGSKIGVSVLCPGFVSTKIMDASRNRPEELAETGPAPDPNDPMIAAFRATLEAGMRPADVAQKVFESIEQGRLHILTHPEFNPAITERVETIVGRNPGSAPLG